MANLLGGHIHASVTTPGSSQANVAAGKVRVLATVPGDRNPLFPDVPSMKELGFDFPMPANLYFVIGPKGLDRAIVDKLYKVFAEAVKTPAIQQFATKNGLIIGVAGPEETAKQIRDMWQLYAKVIKDFKLEVQR
jgi:tripartite-type tricarboxylate transporter receptor subunit TctC